MKIAVTADVHLTTCEDQPARFNALANIFESLADLEINQLIIAGDLFNKDIQNYNEFETLCKEHPDITVHVIPGNHDLSVEQKRFATSNIRAYSEPTCVEFGETTFLFLPYQLGTSMGEAVATEADSLETGKWVLVGHGDYCRGIRHSDEHEPKTYMPLFQSDIDRFRPRTVLLGHIHIRSSKDNVHYPGSPCGLNISEVGQRHFLLYDTETAEISPHRVQTDVLFFQESFMIVPREDELKRLETEIQRRIEAWGLDQSELKQVQLRVAARGFCCDKQAISDLLQESFGSFTHYNNKPPDVNDLSASTNEELVSIANRVEQEIDALDWEVGPEDDRPDRDEIMNQALWVIYGDGGA